MLGIYRLAGLSRNLRDGNDAFHCAYVRQLRSSHHDVADSVHAGLGGLHPAIGLDEAPIGLNLRTLEADIFRPRLAAHSDKNFLGVNLFRLPANGERYAHTSLCLLDLVDLGASVEVDAALAVHP